MRNPYTLEIYEIIMTWLEKRFDAPVLRIPLKNTDCGKYEQEQLEYYGYKGNPRILKFDAIIRDGVRGVRHGEREIYYNPNWRDFLTIEEMLNEK